MSRTVTVADRVRSLDAEALTTLLTTRPDLATPAPRSREELASRATTQASTRAAVDSLDAWQLRVLEAVAAVDGLTRAELAAGLAVPADDPHLDRALEALVATLLVLRQGERHHAVGAVVTVLGPHPAGLAAPSPAPMDASQVRERLTAAGPGVRPVLDRLLWAPVGHLPRARRAVNPQEATSPVDLALAHHLLRPQDDQTVVLPREVALELRGGRLFDHPVAGEAPAWPAPRPPGRVAAAGLGTALEAVAAMTALLEAVDRTSPAQLASGGMARRDAQRALARVGPEPDRWLHLALAVTGGLIAADGRHWLLTPGADHWRQADLWAQWLALRQAWCDLGQTPGTLGNGMSEPAPATARALRRRVVAELAGAPTGTPVDAELVVSRLAWRHPRWDVDEQRGAVAAVLAEARVLGVVALGAASGLARREDDPGMPERGDLLILQSDLTAVAPGPLTPTTAADLALLADRESTGVAGVRRFTAASVRRALDAGWTGEQVRTWWRDHSMTGVPQGLLVLLDDVVRDHGRISVAGAGAVVEVDDPAVVESLLRSPRATELGLRRVGETVIVAQDDPAVVLAALREAGWAPVARDAQGRTLTSPPPRRARPVPPPPQVERSDPQAVAEALARHREPATTGAEAVLAQLRAAQREGAWVELNHVDDSGVTVSDEVRVLAVTPGAVRVVVRGGGGGKVVAASHILSVRR